MNNIKLIAAFAGGLLLGAGALSVSPPEDQPTLVSANDQSQVPIPGAENEQALKLPPKEGAVLPPPPEGTPMLPPDGAGSFIDGAPPVEAPGGAPGGETFTSAGLAAKPMAGVLLLDEHIAQAEARWFELRGKSKSKGINAELLARIDALVLSIPDNDGHMPPLQEVVAFLVKERILVDDLGQAGVDVSAADEQLGRLLEPPKGKVVGGHEKAAHPGGAGQAPPGSRPLDPTVPVRVTPGG